MERGSIAILFSACLAAAQDPSAPASPAELLKSFRGSPDPGVRRSAFERLIARDPAAAATLKAVVDPVLAEGERSYAALLAPRIRAAYLERLGSLGEEQVRKVLATRRHWKDYLLHGGDREDFRELYLKPIREIAGSLLFRVEDLPDEELRATRARLLEYGGYQARCDAILKIDPDPAKGRKSPTGIAYAPLTQPPAFADRLRHLERTLLLCHTVASSGARRVLLMNDAAAREIDVQEAEFGLFCNEVRMLAGTVAWRVEPLGCAVTRDHSHDRKEGRASGHMSDVPGKRGFTDRNERMGAPFYHSEGAGGGNSGRDYAEGLSYGGGHTGPLYSLVRNCVGVGRRDGVYTSQYRLDKSLLHPCPATEDELWMPPGVEAADLPGGELRAVYRAMKAGAFGAASALAARLKPRDGLERAVAAFFGAAADVEADWAADGVAEIEKTGDLFEAKRRLADGLKRFKGMPRFEERTSAVSERLKAKEAKDEIEAGEAFRRILAIPLKEEAMRIPALRQFGKRHEASAYARAVEAALKERKGEIAWFGYFVGRNPNAKNYGYPASAESGR